MSSGQGRVDVEVESKRPDEGSGGAKHPNTCPTCGSHYRDDELEQTLRVCPQCGHHFRVRARERIAQLVDPDSFVEEDEDLRSADPLGFFDLRPYTERLAEAEVETGLGDAIVCGAGMIEDVGCQLAVMDFAFMGGSMGSVVGEKFARACERATERRRDARLGLRLRRRPDAGGDPRAHAAPEDRVRDRRAARVRKRARLRPHASDDRRSPRELRRASATSSSPSPER